VSREAAPLRIARIVALAVLALALVACTRGRADLEMKVKEILDRKGAPLEPLPIIRTFESFEYTAQDLRDPFTASIDTEALALAEANRPDANRPREPLESFPLDALDMVGTLGLTTDMTALVKDPDGVIHRVRVDNYMGQNFGRVIGIYEDRIELVELIQNASGDGWVERSAAIALDDE
jgi:type IV pilus assembly protein PilP